MADDSSEEKTHDPTEKRKRDAREEGQVAKSKELNSLFVLISVLIYMVSMHNYLVRDCYQLFDFAFATAGQKGYIQIPLSQIFLTLQSLVSVGFRIFIIPVILAGAVAGTVAMVQAGGFIVSPKVMSIDLKKLDPIKNDKFSITLIFQLQFSPFFLPIYPLRY